MVVGGQAKVGEHFVLIGTVVLLHLARATQRHAEPELPVQSEALLDHAVVNP